jgi:hypothetical protein
MSNSGSISQTSRLAFFTIALLGTACNFVQVRYPQGTTEYLSRAEFEVYVEAVFRYHNQVLNDLIVATSFVDEDELDNPQLEEAEIRMQAACQPLNAIVSATMEGREIGFFTKLQLPESAPACEARSRHVAALLAPS